VSSVTSNLDRGDGCLPLAWSWTAAGMGVRREGPKLRGVRGEIVHLGDAFALPSISRTDPDQDVDGTGRLAPRFVRHARA
jgi:hypothetical protein